MDRWSIHWLGHFHSRLRRRRSIDNYKKWCKSEWDWGEESTTGGYNLINERGLSYWKWCEKIYRDNSIWEEKIRFFYDFPELVEMRDFIRSNL